MSFHPPRRLLAAALALALSGCASIEQMKQKYEQGDQSQLQGLIKILEAPDYPYATRKRAARALGELKAKQAVPPLIRALDDADPRDGLEQEAIIALGRIGDETAVRPLAQAFNRYETLRGEVIHALGQIGGTQAATVLIGGLKYYTRQIAIRERRSDSPYGEEAVPPSPTMPDTLRGGAGRPPLDDETSVRKRRAKMIPSGGIFSGEPVEIEIQEEDVETRWKEVVQTLVQIGDKTIPAITTALKERLQPGDVDVKDQLAEILKQIVGDEPEGAPPKEK